MGFLNIILLIIKYGPAIFNLIKAAIELIRWLRENDDEAFVKFADESSVEADLKSMAKRCKKAKDVSELQAFVDNLKVRKEQVLAKKGL